MGIMEEAVSLILRGCSLARELEFNVLNLGNNSSVNLRQPHLLAQSCDEILSVFAAAKDRLERPPLTPAQRNVGLEEWLRSTCSQAMELAQLQMTTSVVAPPPPAAVEDSGKMVGMGFASSSQKPRTR